MVGMIRGVRVLVREIEGRERTDLKGMRVALWKLEGVVKKGEMAS
jgi:hypothetical protein